MACKADIPHLACLLRLHHGFHAAALGEDAVRIFQTNHLVELHQVHMVGLEPLQRFVDLPRRLVLGAPVDLGHQEDLVAIPARKRLAHAHFADSAVIVPAIVHEV